MLVVVYGLFSLEPDAAVKHVHFHESTELAGACGIRIASLGIEEYGPYYYCVHNYFIVFVPCATSPSKMIITTF